MSGTFLREMKPRLQESSSQEAERQWFQQNLFIQRSAPRIFNFLKSWDLLLSLKNHFCDIFDKRWESKFNSNKETRSLLGNGEDQNSKSNKIGEQIIVWNGLQTTLRYSFVEVSQVMKLKWLVSWHSPGHREKNAILRWKRKRKHQKWNLPISLNTWGENLIYSSELSIPEKGHWTCTDRHINWSSNVAPALMLPEPPHRRPPRGCCTQPLYGHVLCF